MMKYLILIFLLLTACSMTNEEIVEEVNYCKDNEMDFQVISNGFTLRVTKIICRPKQGK